MIRIGALHRITLFVLLVLVTGCSSIIIDPPINGVAALPAEPQPNPTVASLFLVQPTLEPTPTFTPRPIVAVLPTSTPTPLPTTISIAPRDPAETFLAAFDTPLESERETIDEPIRIEIANQSGVSGYAVAAFGGGFGTRPVSVTILGAKAEILEWDFDYVRVVVPDVPDGSGELVITNVNGDEVASPFTVYSIDPQFLVSPTSDYKNVLRGKRAALQGVEVSYCNEQPSNESAEPEKFLTNFQCGRDGIVAGGIATFSADSDLGTVGMVSVDMQQTLSGRYIFQFESDTHWYARKDEPSFLNSLPRDYEVQVSADSTNGTDGNWVTLAAVNGNVRGSRSHAFWVSAEDNFRWVRLHVTNGLKDHSDAAGRDFSLREVRLFSTEGELPYSFGLYGDSLTFAAFEMMGPYGFAGQVKKMTNSQADLHTSFFGLIGQDSEGLLNSDASTADIYDALWLDNNQEMLRYWGIAIGTNDTDDDPATIWQARTNLGDYGARLDSIVSYLISVGRVPMLARIPDTDASIGGFGTIETKSHILSQIDAVQARYRLIPGPDLYTIFRRQVELGDGSWFTDDGTHHADKGRLALNRLWAEAFAKAVNQD